MELSLVFILPLVIAVQSHRRSYYPLDCGTCYNKWAAWDTCKPTFSISRGGPSCGYDGVQYRTRTSTISKTWSCRQTYCRSRPLVGYKSCRLQGMDPTTHRDMCNDDFTCDYLTPDFSTDCEAYSINGNAQFTLRTMQFSTGYPLTLVNSTGTGDPYGYAMISKIFVGSPNKFCLDVQFELQPNVAMFLLKVNPQTAIGVRDEYFRKLFAFYRPNNKPVLDRIDGQKINVLSVSRSPSRSISVQFKSYHMFSITVLMFPSSGVNTGLSHVTKLTLKECK